MPVATVTGAVLVKPYLMIGTTDLSAFVTDIHLADEYAEIESGAGGKTGKARFAGLQDQVIKVTMNQGFAAGGPDVTIRGVRGSSFLVTLRQSTDARGAENPEYAYYGQIFSYDPFGGGAVGAKQEITVDIKLADGVPATPDVS